MPLKGECHNGTIYHYDIMEHNFNFVALVEYTGLYWTASIKSNYCSNNFYDRWTDFGPSRNFRNNFRCNITRRMEWRR